ncbi:MAG: flagellar basal-body MS-ring/collar protein FliF [Myxococcota bacterium]
MTTLLQRLSTLWGRLPASQRAALASALAVTAGVLSLLVYLAGQPSFVTLYADLEPQDATRILDALESQQVPHRLSRAGTAIEVPSDKVYELRLQLASQGLPSSGTVGFEVFDKSDLGATPFQQRIRFRRAIEGELGRTISRLEPIQWARVHISLPERSAFKRDRQAPSAAVVVSLRPGRALDGSEARGIAHLISGAVEGLETKQITIVDAQGRTLLRPSGGEDAALAASALDVRRGLERELTARAQSLLDAALGAGHSVITVAATIDRRRIDATQERVNPDESAVVSEQRVEEVRSEPSSQSGGIPGTRSNVPPGGAGDESGAGQSNETVTRETTNFEISRSRSHTVVPIGSLKKLSVAVLVDGTYSTPEAAAGEPRPAPVYAPRTQEELSQIEEIVKRSVGFDEDRGDSIRVENLEFRSPLADVPVEDLPLWQRPELFVLLPSVMKMLAVLGGIILLVFFVLRPMVRQLMTLPALEVTAGGAAEAGAATGEGAGLALSARPPDLSIPLSKDDAKLVADAVKQWLRE